MQAVNGIVESVVAAKLRITPPTVHLDATYVAAVLSVLAGCLCESLMVIRVERVVPLSATKPVQPLCSVS